MHYKNGREAKNGDKVLVLPQHGAPMLGIVYDINPGSTTCNAYLAPIAPASFQHSVLVTLSDGLHLDDVLAALEPKAKAEDASTSGTSSGT